MASREATYYYQKLYPWQDEIIQLLSRLETQFYLTGGTAASRGYLNHRFSDDLDLFVNDNPSFPLWSARIIDMCSRDNRWATRVLVREERFIRIS